MARFVERPVSLPFRDVLLSLSIIDRKEAFIVCLGTANSGYLNDHTHLETQGSPGDQPS